MVRKHTYASQAPGGEDEAPVCRTCGGTGRLKHPSTGKASVKCPSCQGTGLYEPDDDDTAAPGAALDQYPWAKSFSSFLGAIRDKSDPLGARAACGRVLDEANRPRNALSERVPSEGGFLLPENLRQQILAYMMPSIVRPRCTLVPMNSLRVPIPVLDNPSQASGAQALGGLTFSFTPPGSAIPASVPDFGRADLEAWSDKAMLKDVPNELLFDSPAFTEDFLPRIVAEGLAWHVDDVAIFQGTGVGQPQALVNAPGQVTVTRNTSDAVLHIDVVALLKALHPASKTSATWLCSEDCFDQLLELYELAGSSPTNTTISPPNVLKVKGGQWTLFGLPLIPNDHQPAVGTTGDLMLCDMSLLLLGERGQMTVEVAPEVNFLSDTSWIRFRYRWDARYWPQEPITLANGKVTSPLAVLQ